MSINDTPHSSRRKWVIPAIIAAVLVVAAIIAVLAFSSKDGNNAQAVVVTKPSPTATAPANACTTWKIEYSNYSNNRWFGNGITEIKDAKTEKEAAKAADVWLNEVRKDPNLLSGAAKYFLNRDVDKTSLITEKCASDTAVQLYTELKLTIGSAKSIVPSEAPATGYNSGVNNAVVVGSTAPGIGGDRKAIQVTLPDGRVIWIMARCGNIVTSGPPPVPAGHADECLPGEKGTFPNCWVPCSANPSVPQSSPDCSKDWSKSVPAPTNVAPAPNDSYEPRPPLPANPAPVQSAGPAPSSSSTAPGATPAQPDRPLPPPATGTTSDGGAGSVNGTSGGNDGTIVNPFGG